MKYELLESIGTGGMATVHRARMRGVAGFERTVAIKRIRPELALDAEYVARFITEARVVSMFSHPNVVQVFELGRIQDTHFIAMEHLEGWSLLRLAAAAYAQNIRIPLAVIVSLLHDLCEALDHIHGRGIIHRDISHGNLFVLRTGHLKVIDFGIAQPPSSARSTEIVGKPSYMSPEVIRGTACDERTDVFAAGIIAWELLANAKLFSGTDDRATMRAVLEQPIVSPSEHRADCPLLLDAIVRDALSRDVGRRTASAAVMREQLETFAEMTELDVRPGVVAKWIEESGVFDGPFMDVHTAVPTTMLEAPTLRARVQPPTPPIARIRPRSRRFVWARAMAAAAIAMLSFGVVSRAASPTPPPREGEHVTMTPTTPMPPPVVAVPAEPISVPAPAKVPPRPPRTRIAVRSVRPTPAPSSIPVPPPPPAPVAAAVKVAEPIEVAPPAITPPVAKPAPTPSGPRMIAPDRVRLVAGEVRYVNAARSVRRSFTAVLCIDERGAVTSSKLPSDLPDPVRISISRDLAQFRFTPYPEGKACFARFVKIAR